MHNAEKQVNLRPLLLIIFFMVRVRAEPPFVDEKSFTTLSTPIRGHANERVSGCNTWLRMRPGSSAAFNSPFFPKHYSTKRCHWVFEATGLNDRLSVTCKKFDITGEYFGYCLGDVLYVYTSRFDSQSFCGKKGPVSVTSVYRWLYVAFRPSLFAVPTYEGFSCTVSVIAGTTTTIKPVTNAVTSTVTVTDATVTVAVTGTVTTKNDTMMSVSVTPVTVPTAVTGSAAVINVTGITPTPSEVTSGVMLNATSNAQMNTSTTDTETTTSMTTAIKNTSIANTTTSATATTTTTTKRTSTRESTKITPEPCRCGRKGRLPSSRIVGGKDALRHEFPWQAALVRRRNPRQIICGAVLINNQFVLTAAHCVQYSSTVDQVVLGEHDRSISDETRETIYRDIVSTVVRSDYNSATLDNDIALVKFSGAVDLSASEAVKPVCLPQRNDLYVGVEATVTGWGLLSTYGSQPNVLQRVNVTIVSNEKCQAMYDNKVITKNMICAADPGRDSCQGDSGGPLIVPEGDNYYVLVGLVSFGVLCAHPRYPGGYTRLTRYVDWIRENVGNAEMCLD